MNDIQINGVSMGIKLVSRAPFEKAISYAGIATTVFTDAVLKATWQWKLTDAAQERIFGYRLASTNTPGCGKGMLRYFEREILRQRRLDRRYRSPLFFRLERKAICNEYCKST